MRSLIVLALTAGLLVGCADPTNPNTPVNVQALDIQGRAARCLPYDEVGVYFGSYELKGDLRNRFLTPEARNAGVRVYREANNVTTYGSQTIYYTNADGNCVLWMEGLTLQEYSQRLGLNPVGLSPFYEVEKPPVNTPPPAIAPKAN